MNEIIENNRVTIIGEITSGFAYSHELSGKKFYIVNVKVLRLSDACDIIPVMVSDQLMDVSEDLTGRLVSVNGQLRSYNRLEGGRTHLILSVSAREIAFVDEIKKSPENNQIYLDGYICKVPVYRRTPLGREITDVMLAVNRPYGKSDYIPCIFWGWNARKASGFRVGDRHAIQGRIQSREYMKKLDEEHMEKRETFEVSVIKMKI